MKNNEDGKIPLVTHLLEKAYGSPARRHTRIPNTAICPQCYAELAFVLPDPPFFVNFRRLLCAACGVVYAVPECAA